MKVSIIVSSYNYERHIVESIESAFHQTYRDIEVIIVDDGSTDSSPAIMRRYEDRAKLLFKENGGQGSAFNLAYRHASGDLIVFLDSDDVLHPTAVEKIVAACKPGDSKVHFPLEIIGDDGTKTGAIVPRAKLPEGDIREQLLREGMYVSPPNSGNAFSKEFLDQVMPLPEKEWAYGPDTYMVFLAPLFGRVAAVHEPLGLYRRHIQSVTNITMAGIPEVGKKLQSMVRASFALRELLARFARQQGLAMAPEAVADHWLCLKVRLAMSRVAGDLDPFGNEGPFALSRRMLRAVWTTRELGLASRLEFSLWSVLVALLPVRAAVLLIKFAFAPGERGALVRGLLRSAA